MCLKILNKLYAIHKSRYHSCKIAIILNLLKWVQIMTISNLFCLTCLNLPHSKQYCPLKGHFFCRESIYFITQRIWKNLLYFLANMWIVQKWKSILELLKTQTILELKMAQPNSITYIIHESWFQRSSIFSLNETKLKVQKYLVSQ